MRPHLLAVAYRLTGTVVDAEDVVQEAWLRWEANRDTSINDLKAWLTTVVSRLGLDRGTFWWGPPPLCSLKPDSLHAGFG